MKRHSRPAASPPIIKKAATGIIGFDEVTGGGLPRGRPTLVAGGPGCGKTVFAVEFLVHGALEYGEPGVFVAFEEREDELIQNAASLGFDLQRLVKAGQLAIDTIRIERSEIEETGEYDLDGLFVRLGFAIDRTKATRVVLDTLEALFVALPNHAILRAELRRLFRWLKDRGVTAIITAERGDGTLTRHGLEEYVSDCVVVLDHRVHGQVSTRRLRVAKYRGSAHGTNEYPFLIGDSGISVLPITSLELHHPAPTTRVSTGLPTLDDMLGGGLFRGASVLVSGTPGAGKTSLAATFVRAACQRGERCLYFAFEESPEQIIRNMRSIGLDLQPWAADGLLGFRPARAQAHGLETHLALMQRDIVQTTPACVVIDPITNLRQVSSYDEAQAMLTRLIDVLKSRGITAVYTSLTSDREAPEQSEAGVSSLMDTWLLLRNLESDGERNRGVYVLKARGTAHSNQIREFRLTNTGMQLLDAYTGPNGVLTGRARAAHEAQHRDDVARSERDRERRYQTFLRRQAALEARLLALRAAFHAEQRDVAAAPAEHPAPVVRAADASGGNGHGQGSAFAAPTRPRSAGSPKGTRHGRSR